VCNTLHNAQRHVANTAHDAASSGCTSQVADKPNSGRDRGDTVLMSNVPALLMNKVEQRHAWMTTHQIGDNPSRVEPDAASYSGRITYMKVISMTLCC
jgi:hypothetical protein